MYLAEGYQPFHIYDVRIALERDEGVKEDLRHDRVVFDEDIKHSIEGPHNAYSDPYTKYSHIAWAMEHLIVAGLADSELEAFDLVYQAREIMKQRMIDDGEA